MATKWYDRLLPQPKRLISIIRQVVTGSLYKTSYKSDTDISDIRKIIDTMRALASDSQISTALAYYATDATIPNTDDMIIWATSKDNPEIAEIINKQFKRWDINSYARDHILELATMGNLYIPTTEMYKEPGDNSSKGISLDSNTIPIPDFDIVPSYKVMPQDIVHIWDKGAPQGYIYQESDESSNRRSFAGDDYIYYPESAVVHFSLGGLLGEYKLDCKLYNGEEKTYDIAFAKPLMHAAIQPTQTLSLFEDSLLLSSLISVVRFINVECGNSAEEEEVISTLQQIKDAIEQQLSIDTAAGDVQSFLNPQSPNNLIYVPKINGQDAVSITDLNMTETTMADNKLLQHFMDKKLSVLGVPKEALNFSSNEGLGGAGTVLAQRSQIYANSLQRLMTAYKQGWTRAINLRFSMIGLSGFVDCFKLEMTPILTQHSALQFEKRDSALTQVTTYVQLLKDLGITEEEAFVEGIAEILNEVFPQIAAKIVNWGKGIELEEGEGGAGVDAF